MDEVKELILESVKAWKNYKKKMPSRSTAGVTRPSRSAQGRSNVSSQLSGLEDVVFNDFIKDDCIPKVMVKSPQFLHPMSVGDVPAIVNIKTLKGRLMAILGGWWVC